MNNIKDEKIRCICNQEIRSHKDYTLVVLKDVTNEIDIFCPNPMCSTRELGYIEFLKHEKGLVFEKAKFYPTFVSYNVKTRNDSKYSLLRQHLVAIIKELDWKNISKIVKNN